MPKKRFLYALFMLTVSLTSQAQISKDSKLYRTILSKDSLLFNVGFNTCNIAQFEALVCDQLEFFHDQGGYADRTKFLNDLRNGLCKSPADFQARRELLPETTEIFALYNNGTLYGVIQQGMHQFFEKQPNKPEKMGSSARFTHLWLLENNEWKLSKVLSYEHQEKQPAVAHTSLFTNDAEMENWLRQNKVPTLGIGLIKDGRLNQVKVYGELQQGIAAPYNTLFNVASLTKPITAMLTLQLVSLGRWNLDEPIYKYWIDPDVSKDENVKKLTTRHILTHQTGFTNWRGNNPDGKLHFAFAPGTKYQYSGEGFEYLRKALENKFRKPLNQLAAELIFEPLKMKDTKYFWDNKTDSTRFAAGYNSEGVPYTTIKNKTANAADDLLTTVEDYGIFLASVLNGNGLSEKVFTDMVTHQVATKKNKYFGLGFEIYDLGNGEYALSHGGSDKGCQTIVFLLPATKQGLIIFTNVDDGYKVYEKLLLHYLGSNGRKIIDIEMKQ
ncbi:MAG: class A beta-lactamase-related serine hydrolase [Bacteroidetes bacterium]|nr:class A beta-lactamase-related serine hydrolase [Bacteroidota bacterium]